MIIASSGNLIKNDFDEAFSNVDVIMTPTTRGPAFDIGSKGSDPIQMYLDFWIHLIFKLIDRLMKFLTKMLCGFRKGNTYSIIIIKSSFLGARTFL